jgi:hypothetical protein
MEHLEVLSKNKKGRETFHGLKKKPRARFAHGCRIVMFGWLD